MRGLGQRAQLIFLGLLLSFNAQALRSSPTTSFQFPSCSPESSYYSEIKDPYMEIFKNSPSAARGESFTKGLDIQFCSEWNPDFRYNGHRCCAGQQARRRRRAPRCAPERRRGNYCHERTTEQLWYENQVKTGKIKDVLSYLTQEMGRGGPQSYCSVNNGFLVRGRQLIPTPTNRILLRNPDRCSEYGVDSLVAMTEWLGRQVATSYPDPVHLVIGDITAPRGGCIGHASHRTGLDIDIAFLFAKAGKNTPSGFHRTFELADNWWLIKDIFKNPYACVRIIFLDRKLINKLARKYGGEDDWKKFGKFIRHMPRHKDHLHVRVGEFPGQPGCTSGANPELEEDEYGDEEDPTGDGTATDAEEGEAGEG